MAKGIRYTGEFMSIDGSRYRAEIWQEGFTGKPVELTFPYETPVSIEWAKVDKLEPVMSSAATLMVVSERDRQFVDLYTTKAGSTRLDIYRNNKLYWSGTLDPEIYEEPFSRQKDYEVTLTFSDFAPLDRIPFEQAAANRGRLKMRAVIDLCMKKSGINTGADWQTFLSTTTSAGASLLDGVYVSEDNFFDEDGEPMTLREVLEGVLRPFGLQMIQKDGCINLYDLHALEATQPRRVRWCLDDSALGVDKTYNNCELTFSPYMNTDLFNCELSDKEVVGGTEYTYDTAVFDQNGLLPGFKLRLSTKTKSKIWKADTSANGWHYFSITPYMSGDKSAGVAAVADMHDTGSKTFYPLTGRSVSAVPGGALMIAERPYVGGVNYDFLLNLKVDVLIDLRYNPFEEGEVSYNYNNFSQNQEAFEKLCNTNYIPFRCILHGIDGSTWHYVNVIKNDGLFVPRNEFAGVWEKGEGGWDKSYLCFFDPDDRSEKSGLGGWKTNRPVIAMSALKTPSGYRMYKEGEYLMLPPVAGHLELQISNALIVSDLGRKGKVSLTESERLYDFIHWFLIRKIEMKLVDKFGRDVDKNDIVLRAWVDQNAREELKLDTVCGTLPDGAHPTARGQFFTPAGNVITSFRRAGVTDKVERLLLGTVYSQFHGRKKKLSGTADLVSKFCTLTDEHEAGKFVVVSEVQNLLRDESNLAMTEIVKDNYTGVPFNE